MTLKKTAILILFFVFFAMFSSAPMLAAAETKGPVYDNQEVNLLYSVIYHHVSQKSKLGPEWSNWIAHSILFLSEKWGVHPFLATALMSHESSFRPDAVSPVGALGISQIMPGTAAAMGIDPYDPAQNLEGGIAYLAQQINAFANAGEWSVSYAIAAYNAGPNAIRQYGGIPPYSETINHLNQIAKIYQELIDTYNSNL